MKRATTISLLLHLGAIALVFLLGLLLKYIKETSQHTLQLSLKSTSIQAQIIYLNNTTVTEHKLSSIANPEKAQFVKNSNTQQSPPQLLRSAKTQRFTLQEKQEVKKITSLSETTNKAHNKISLNTDATATNFSRSTEINNAFKALQNALVNYLAKQAAPIESLTFEVTITLDEYGKLQKITFSPFPPKELQNLLTKFFEDQRYTHRLFMPNNIQLKIPVRLYAHGNYN